MSFKLFHAALPLQAPQAIQCDGVGGSRVSSAKEGCFLCKEKSVLWREKKKKCRKVRVKMWSCPRKQKFIAVALTVILLNTIFAVFCLDPIVGNVRNDKSREIFLEIFLVLQRP